MRKVFVGLAALLLLAIVTQFYLAAFGAADLSYDLHRTVGHTASALAVLTTIFAALARMPGKVIGLAGLLVGLIVIQNLIVTVADALKDTGDMPTTAASLVFGLHAVNGLAIMAGAGILLRRGRKLAMDGAGPITVASGGGPAPATPGVPPSSS